MAAALRTPGSGHAALEAARELIERIEVRPAEGAKGVEIELVGEIAALVRLGMGERGNKQVAAAGDRALFDRSVKVVAGTGFEPVTFRL